MSAVRTYLEEKSGEPPKEWLRREPRTTHPEILEAVRDFEAAGGFYDDDAERFVNERAGDLPPHEHHGADRHPLIEQLGHEVYIAKGCLKDERAQADIDASIADGFTMLSGEQLEEGQRYIVRLGTLYCGQEMPTFGEPREVRVKGKLLLPRGARTQGYSASRTVLAQKVAA